MYSLNARDQFNYSPLPRPREGGLRRGENVWFRLTTASAQCLRLLRALFSLADASVLMYKVECLYVRLSPITPHHYCLPLGETTTKTGKHWSA